MKPYQAAIARGVGIGMLGGTFGMLTSMVAGGQTAREVLVPAAMSAVFWGCLIGFSIYFDSRDAVGSVEQFTVPIRR